MELLKEWIETCNKGHAGRCHTFEDPWARIELTTNLLFIDVEQRCLVKQRDLSDTIKYVALSYVWGTDKDPLQTLQSNVEALSQVGAFCTKQFTPPLTILDSMKVVSSLGLRYLWVDRFCIVQDDEITKQAHLAAMASVYANAYLTIAASDGAAGSGIAGSNAKRQREAPYGDFKFSKTCRMLLKYPIDLRQGEVQTYDTRGWTFQEWTLSHRILKFHDCTVSWKCGALCQQENGLKPSIGSVYHRGTEGDTAKGKIWTNWPNITAYLDSVGEYADRDLTDKKDKLKAFAAMMHVQGRFMKGRMLHGIPELFFSDSLLWAPLPEQSRCEG